MGVRQYVCVAAILAAMPAWATVVVQQIEADVDGDSTNGFQYAPVDFGTNSTYVYDSTTTLYDTNNQSTAYSTYSGHADAVASYMYGVNSVAGSIINKVENGYAGDFLNSLGVQYSTGSAAAPTSLINTINTNSIRVSNHSYVGSFASTSVLGTSVNTDRDAIRRLDYVITTTDLVLVAGAVTNGSAGTTYSNSSYSPIVWSSYNSIAVSGSQTFSPLTDSANRVGKIHADVYFNDAASFGTARVSGYAAGLIGVGQTMNTDAQKGLVIKSVIMTGATKDSSWTRDLTNNLSVNYGAGTANYTNSKAILTAGEKTLVSVGTNKTVTASAAANATSSTAGWAYSSSLPSSGNSSALILNSTGTITDFTATLNWYVSSPTRGQNIDTSDSAIIFPHLYLDLCSVTVNANGSLTIGNALSTIGLTSEVTDDNVQHLYASNLALDAGYYALVVTNKTTDGDTSDYALSYSYTALAAVPEPASIALLGFGAAGLLLSRKRRAA